MEAASLAILNGKHWVYNIFKAQMLNVLRLCEAHNFFLGRRQTFYLQTEPS